MVNWLAPVIITLNDLHALWEFEPDSSHGSEYLLALLAAHSRRHSGDDSGKDHPQAAAPPPEALGTKRMRAAILASAHPLEKWRNPDIHSQGLHHVKDSLRLDPATFDAKAKPSNELMAVIIAAVASRTAVAPLERLKVMLQTDAFSNASASAAAGLPRSDRTMRFGLGLVFRLVLQFDGVRLGLFRGNGMNSLRAVPVAVSQFASYNIFRSVLAENGVYNLSRQTEIAVAAGNVSFFMKWVTSTAFLRYSGLAGVVSITLTHPLEVIRTRLYLMHSRPDPLLTNVSSNLIPASSAWNTTKQIFQHEGGLRGLYRGLNWSLVGIVPYLSSSFVLFETFKPASKNQPPVEQGDNASNGSLSSSSSVTFKSIAVASASAAFAQTVTYPFDLIRRRLMVEGLLLRSSGGVRGRGAVKIFRDILATDGTLGLFRGVFPNLLKIVPATGVSLFVHDQWRNAA
ncbi:hypothetical protein HDU82_008268 [Entophlyctis luteolus]|nr:hypothetical protein HDU82_008268 [Entophlyctis luteolus]